MSNWTNDDVLQWLKTNGFKNYSTRFQEQQIDGHRFFRLTDEEILSLLTRSNNDGNEQRPTMGIQIRFRTKFNELKQKYREEQQRRKPIEEERPSTQMSEREETKKKDQSNKTIRQYNYFIDEENHLQFFKKSNFVNYLFDFVKKQTMTNIPIELINNPSKDDYSPMTLTIRFEGFKSEIRIVRNSLRQLFQSIQIKKYRYPIMKRWFSCSTADKIIQQIFDAQTSLWTICQFYGMIDHRLEILFFNDDQFNRTSTISSIDEIVEKNISIERFFVTTENRILLIEYPDPDGNKSSWNTNICRTQLYTDEYQRILQSYQQDNHSSLISIDEENQRKRMSVSIFGWTKLVNQLIRQLEDLFKKHRKRQFPFTQLSTVEIDCLRQLCQKELKQMETDRDQSWVEFDWKNSPFFAPIYAKDQIESQMKQMFNQLQRQTIKTDEFYYNLHQQIELQIKKLVKSSQCYSIIKRKTKMKSFPMIQSSFTDVESVSPLFSNRVHSSPWIVTQLKFPNGSIATSISDITQQKVDILIIPSFRSGLREYLMSCAGNIQETNSSSHPNRQQISFITETTSGNLQCEKIYFVDWSIPQQMPSADVFIPSIQYFVSQLFDYLAKHEKTSTKTVRSMAMAMPEICDDEETFSEEFLDEFIHQMHSIQSFSFQISFIFLPDQEKFYQKFNDALRLYQQTDQNPYGVFFCSSTVLTITCLSMTNENLERFRKILNHYLKRSITTKSLDSFDRWNPSLISQFYALAQQKSVLPRFNDESRDKMTLYGPIVDLEQLSNQYQWIHYSLDIRRNDFKDQRLSNIQLHFASNDSIVGEKLFNRLSNDGFQMKTHPLTCSSEAMIIVCISDSALDDDQYRKDLITAYDSGQRLIPIQIAPYRTTRWLRRILENQSVLRFFGSDTYVDLQYQKLILKIISYLPSSLSKNKDSSLSFLLTLEERKSVYEQQVAQLSRIKKNRFSTEERKNLLSLIEETLHESAETFPPAYLQSFFDGYVTKGSDDHQQLNTTLTIIEDEIKNSSLRRWIDRLLRGSIKQNLPPFSPTGDYNDAPFRSSTMISSILSLAVLFGSQFWSSCPNEKPSDNKPRALRKRNLFSWRPPSKVTPKIHSRPATTSTPSSQTAVSSRPARIDKDRQEKRRPRVDIEARNARCQPMVEHLKKGFEEFQRLCNEYQPEKKEPVQQDIKVLFTPSPFNNTNIQYRKALEIRPNINHPLKFLWNGVSEIEERISKRKDASVFFSFEPISSCAHNQ